MCLEIKKDSARKLAAIRRRKTPLTVYKSLRRMNFPAGLQSPSRHMAWGPGVNVAQGKRPAGKKMKPGRRLGQGVLHFHLSARTAKREWGEPVVAVTVSPRDVVAVGTLLHSRTTCLAARKCLLSKSEYERAANGK